MVQNYGNILKIIRWIALIAGIGLSVAFAGLIIFAGGSFIEGLTNETPIQINKEFVMDILGLLSAILIIVSVIIAWFKCKLGGLLIIVFAIVHIIATYEPEIAWLQISILPVGFILLLSPSYSKSELESETEAEET